MMWSVGVLALLAIVGFIVQVSTDPNGWVSAFVNTVFTLAIPACGYQGIRGHSRSFMWVFLSCTAVCNILCVVLTLVINFVAVSNGVSVAVGVVVYYFIYSIITLVASVVAVVYGSRLLRENPQYFDPYPVPPQGVYYTPSSSSAYMAQPPGGPSTSV
jgi:hypothetical protein